MTVHLLLDGKKNKKLASTMQIHNTTKILTYSVARVDSCICAGECLKICYAKAGPLNAPSCRMAYDFRYEMSKTNQFVELIDSELSEYAYVKKLIVRLHVVGDFYDADYLDKWVTIAKHNPTVTFYAYTKSVKIVKDYGKLPKNLIIAYSYGGTQDNLIDTKKDRHVIIIPSHADAPAGYTLCGSDDLTMLKHKKIAIRLHGVTKDKDVDFNKFCPKKRE